MKTHFSNTNPQNLTLEQIRRGAYMVGYSDASVELSKCAGCKYENALPKPCSVCSRCFTDHYESNNDTKLKKGGAQ